MKPPIPGGWVCRSPHGGTAPQVRRNAELRLAEKAAVDSLRDQGIEPIGDVLEAFAEIVAEARALKVFFAGKVADLDSVRYESETGTEQLRSEVALYERAMDRTGKLLTEWVRLGLDERRIIIAERQGEWVVAMMERIIEQLELTPVQQAQLALAIESVIIEAQEASPHDRT